MIITAVDRLPVNPALRAAAERLLLDAGPRPRRHRPGRPAGTVRGPGSTPTATRPRDERPLEREERAAHHGRFLSITDDGIGGVRLTGPRHRRGRRLARRRATSRLPHPPRPAPGACGGDPARSPRGSLRGRDCAHDGRDPREHGARLWDALVQATRLLADTEPLPDSHGASPGSP